MEDSWPSYFDPFDEIIESPFYYNPSYNDYGFFNSDNEWVSSPLGEDVIAQTLDAMIQQTPDPPEEQVNAQLQAQLQQQHQNTGPEDRSDILPNVIFKHVSDGCIFFPDLAFARSTISSLQSVSKSKDLKGYFLIPARFISRIRSGPGCHNKQTSGLFLSPELHSFDHLLE